MQDDLSELEAAARLGVTQAALADLRRDHLNAPEHWHKKARHVLYTPAGITAAAAILAGPESAPGEAASAVPDPSKNLREFVVWRTGRRNARILEARPVGEPGSIVRVQVMDTRNWLIGMKFQARQLAGDLWTHWDPKTNSAARSPRFRGKF